METELKKAFTWEIDNFSERNNKIESDHFSSCGDEWCLRVYPKGDDDGSHHLSMYLCVANPESLRSGWKTRTGYCFALLNQCGKELYRRSVCNLFSAEASSWGFGMTLPLSKLQEKGFMENKKLTIEVYIKVVEAVHKVKSTENEMFDFNGFQVVASQFDSVNNIFEQHPDFAEDIRPKNKEVKTAYMNLLLGLIETLCKPPQSLSETELRNADSELTELTEAGFKLDWLKSKLEEVSLESKKAISNDVQVQQLEELIKNVELTFSDLKVELDKEKIKSATVADNVYSFEFIDFFIDRLFLSCFSISKH